MTALGVSLRLQNNVLTEMPLQWTCPYGNVLMEFPYDEKETPSTVLFVLLVSTREYYRMVKEFLRKIFLDPSYIKVR